MKFTLEEQETIIRWDRANPEAIVYTFDPALKRKLAELERFSPDTIKLLNEDNGSVEYSIPKSLVSVRKPRTISEEAKERMRETGSRLAKMKRPEEDTIQLSLLQV